MNAQQAFELSYSELIKLDISKELEEILRRIEVGAKQGLLATGSPPLDTRTGERLNIELMELGFNSSVQSGGAAGVVVVFVNWLWLPHPNRIQEMNKTLMVNVEKILAEGELKQ
jgi:hypothetical protein